MYAQVIDRTNLANLPQIIRHTSPQYPTKLYNYPPINKEYFLNYCLRARRDLEVITTIYLTYKGRIRRAKALI